MIVSTAQQRSRLLAGLLVLDLAGGLLFHELHEAHAKELGVPLPVLWAVAVMKGAAAGTLLLSDGSPRRRTIAAGAVAAHGIWAARLMLRNNELPPAVYALSQSALSASVALQR